MGIFTNRTTVRNLLTASLLTLFYFAGQAQCPAGLGTGVVNVASLPYSVTGETTCGAVNNLTSANTIACGSTNYTSAEDKVYIFTPTTSGTYTISLTSTSSWVGLKLYAGCPLTGQGGTCVANVGSSTGSKSLSGGLIAGVTYYLWVDQWATPTCIPTYSLSIAPPAAAPANDNCAGAITITPAASCTGTSGTSVSATQELAPTACSGFTASAANEVWYKFVADGTSGYTVSMTGTGGFDGIIGLYSGTCGALTLIGCSDNTTGNGTESFNGGVLAAGTYYYRIYGWAGATGTFTTCVTSVAFNPCSSITALNACGTSNTVTIAAGNGAYDPPATSCGFTTPGQEKIYSYTAPATGTYTITQASSPGYIDYFYKDAAGGCSGSGWTCIQDLNGAVTSTGVANLTAGTQYYFLLDPEGTGGGNVTFTLNCAPPPFDPCAAITNIAACGASTSFTVASGNGAYNPPATSCGFTTPGQETIFTFTPTQTGNYKIAQTASFGYIDWFYKPVSGGCNGTGWTCIQDLNGAVTSTGVASLTAGTQYYIMGDPEGTAGGGVTFSIECPPAPLVNDDCSGAITVSCLGSPYTGTTIGATVDAVYSNCGAGGTNATEVGVWYKYVGNNQQVDVTTCDPVGGTGYDSRITVYSGSCGAFTCVTANDDMTPACSNGSFRSEVLFNAFAGTDYYIFVHGYQTGINTSTTGAFTLTLTCSALCAPQISNDDCATADPLTVGANTPTPVFGNNNCASSTASNPSCFSPFATLPDVWYSFVAPANPAKVVLTYNNGAGTATDLGFATYGSCGGAQIQCQATATSGTAYTLTGLTAGQTYYLQVLGPLGNRGAYTVGMFYETCPSPSALTVGTVTTTTASVSWTENGGATAWDLYYGTNIGTPNGGTTPTEDNISPNTGYVINGLTPQQLYLVCVLIVVPVM